MAKDTLNKITCQEPTTRERMALVESELGQLRQMIAGRIAQENELRQGELKRIEDMLNLRQAGLEKFLESHTLQQNMHDESVHEDIKDLHDRVDDVLKALLEMQKTASSSNPQEQTTAQPETERERRDGITISFKAFISAGALIIILNIVANNAWPVIQQISGFLFK